MNSSTLSCNVRFLLWREEIPRERWIVELSQRFALTQSDVKDLLDSDTVAPGRVSRLAAGFDLTDEELYHENLIASANTDVLRENLRFLMQDLEHGSKKELAKSLGVRQSTVSRWLTGLHHPPDDRLSELREYFGLSHRVDLAIDPIFLSLEPVSSVQRKNWIKRQVDLLAREELADLFPALKRMFG